MAYYIKQGGTIRTSSVSCLLQRKCPKKPVEPLRNRVVSPHPKPKPLLGGSWVVISGVISRETILITHIRGLIPPLITTHEPPCSPRTRPVSEGWMGIVTPPWIFIWDRQGWKLMFKSLGTRVQGGLEFRAEWFRVQGSRAQGL